MGQLISSPAVKEKDNSDAINSDEEEEEEAYDFSSNLPDECLAYVFQSLSSGDRKRCSSVCRRWLCIEGQSRDRLSLDAQSNLVTVIPSLFNRYDSVTKLSLRCDRKSVSIDDEALVQISLRCANLTRLKLRYCRDLTDAGMLRFANNCKRLKNLSCRSCAFGVRGTNAVLNSCSAIEYLSVTRLRGIRDGGAAAAAAASKADQPIGPGLKSICFKEELNNGPLIFGLENIRERKLFRCSVADRVTKVDMMLQELGLNDNKITKIPDISAFKKLLVFAVSYNQISSLHGLSKVSNTLKELYVYKNRIVKMEEIDRFHELQILQLGSNRLRVRYLIS